MSSLPPATSPSQAYSSDSINGTQSLTVRFGAETSDVILDPHSGSCELALKMPILHGHPIESLHTSGTLTEQDGITLLRTDADNLAGFCVLPVPDGGLSLATRTIYNSLFRILDASPALHLYRMWNYVPFINQETDEMENYRQFNVATSPCTSVTGSPAGS